MSGSREVMRSLAMLTQLSLQLLIPILVGVFAGIGLDKLFGSTPLCTVIGAVAGVAAAFRNLYMWSMREIHRTEKSERVRRARQEEGLSDAPKDDTVD